MRPILLRRVVLGDMEARYLQEAGSNVVELQLLPAGGESLPLEPVRRRRTYQSLVQVYFTGDETGPGYSNGATMNHSGSTASLRLSSLQCLPWEAGKEVVTILEHPNGCRLSHHLRWDGCSPVLTVWTEAENPGNEPVCLESLSSFSLGGLSPFRQGSAPGQLWLHRLRSAWSMEGRLCSQPLEELNLEPSWARYGVRRERFGQVGSMPVNQWFPWMVLEDRSEGVFWGCQLGWGGSWQMEILRQDDAAALTGGLADYLYGHWRKLLRPGQRLESPRSVLTVCRGRGVDDAARRLVRSMDSGIPAGPLPLFFNEYCSTWGAPSAQSVAAQMACLRGRGFTHLILDAGWYKPDDAPWDDAMGDYQVSRVQFPQGLAPTVAAIREAGLIPGIWFEPENVGKTAKAYHETRHLLHRDGFVITTPSRRFWDLRDPWVREYLRHRVIDFLREEGFGYVKIDCNETIGLGCDGAESPGEGLRQQMLAIADFYQELRRSVPGIQMELCASGGHRLEPWFLGQFDFASFSDAHECEAIPIIAANLHRAAPPAKLQIWAVLRRQDSLRRIGYSLCAAMLGLMCISGDITELTPAQWAAVDAGLAFYRQASEVIRRGASYRYGPPSDSYDRPQGWQALVRLGENGEMLAVLHRFSEEGPVQISLPAAPSALAAVYDCCGSDIRLSGNILHWSAGEAMSAVAVLLR